MPTHFRGLRRRRHLRQSPATTIHGYQPHSTNPLMRSLGDSAINSASACAYLAGTPATILSLTHRANFSW
ncbi:MAG: hypothetical protein IT422_21600 [Pirellulaceae bacterium]|nr:hypothetical protein [Pirellulaceae bacterium]